MNTKITSAELKMPSLSILRSINSLLSPVVRAAAMIAALAAGSNSIHAQADFEKGYQAFQSYHGADFDTVNLANGNLVLNIPLLSYEQRGGLPPIVISIRSNSTTFQSTPPFSSGPADTQQHEVASGVIGAPWGQPHISISPGGLYWKEERIVTAPKTAIGPEYLTRFVAYDDSGATHSLGGSIANKTAGYIPNIKYSVDGSDLMLQPGTSATGPVLVDRKGNIGGLVDPNGNAIQLQGPCASAPGSGDFFNASLPAWEGYAHGTASAKTIVDSVGRVIPNPAYLEPVAPYSCILDTDQSYFPAVNQESSKCWSNETSETYNFPAEAAAPGTTIAANTNTVPITFCYQKIAVGPSLPTVQHTTEKINETWAVLTAAVLPNGTEWRFYYDSWGQVATVTTPTGEVVQYQYDNGQLAGSRLACGNPPGEIPVEGTPTWPFSNLMSSRMITGRTITVTNPDGSTSTQPWVYNSSIGSGWEGTSNSGLVTVTDPEGNDTVHQFSLLGTPAAGQPVCGPYETQTKYFQGSSTVTKALLLKQIDTQYAVSGIDHANPTNFSNYISIGVLPSTVTTTLYAAGGAIKVRMDAYTYDTFGSYEDYKGTYYPFSFGQKLADCESDFFSSAPTSSAVALRSSSHANYWQSNFGFFAANLIDLPAVDTVYSAGQINFTPGFVNTAPTPCAYGTSQQAQTKYAYDQAPYSAAKIGLQTSVTRWANSGLIPASTNPVSYTHYNSQAMPDEKIDPLKHTTTTTYDSSGLFPSQVQYADLTVEKFVYDDTTGLLMTHTDLNSNTTTYQYDDMRRPTSIVYPAGGGSETYTYTDAAISGGITTPYMLPANCSQVYVPVQFVVSNNGDMPDCAEPWGTTTPSFAFTKAVNSGSPYKETGLADTQGRKVQTQINSDPYGTIYADTAYDLLGRVVSQSNPYRATDDPSYGVTTFTYDAMGRKTIQTQPDGSTQQWCYMSLPTNVQTNCNTQITAGENGSWVDSADELGNDWRRTSDGLDRLASVLEPSGTSSAPTLLTTYVYDTLNNLQTVNQTGVSATSTPASPRIRQFTYNSLSMLLSSQNPEVGNASAVATTTYTYDLDGNLEQKTAPAPNASATSTTAPLDYCYDSMNRLVSKWNPTTTTLPFNCATTQTGSTTLLATYTYGAPGAANGAVGQLIDEKSYLSGTLTSETSPTNYDHMERLTAETQNPYSPTASTYTLTHSYDLAGNMVTDLNSATGITLNYAFDAANRLSSVGSSLTSSGSNTYPATLYQVNKYGPVGISTASYGGDPNTTGLFSLYRYYNKRARLIDNEVYAQTDSFGTGSVVLSGTFAPTDSGTVSITTNNLTVNAAYTATQNNTVQQLADTLAADINQNPNAVVGATVGGNLAGTCTNGYLNANTSTPCAVLTFQAIQIGIYGDVALSASVSSTQSFTATASGTVLTGGVGSPQGGSAAYVYSLVYDKAGNITTAQDPYNGSFNYKYDTLNRLLSATNTTYQPVIYKINSAKDTYQCWSYDGFGNRTFEYDGTTACPTTITNSNTTHYLTYGTNNQITASDAASGYTYSAAGNVTQDPINNYVYDIDGRLCAVQNIAAGTATQYVYDASGRRVASGTINTWPAAGSVCSAPTYAANQFTPTKLFARGANETQELEINVTAASGSAPTATGWHLNVYGPTGLFATYTDTAGSAPALFFNFNDWLGTKRLEVNQSGALTNHWASDPWGDYLTASSAGNDPSENHYTGKERDSESGNDYFGARYYASNIGRWLSPDWSAKVAPVPYAKLDDPQSMNLYAYVGNNPMTRFDADGHWMGWEHTLITQLAYDKVGMARNDSVITATRDVDAGGTNVYVGAIFETQEFKDAQELPVSQKFHFLRNPGASQLSAYNDSMKYITDSANYARSALIRGNQGGFANNLGSALHSIQDSFAHTWRENGTGAISHIECYLCSGNEMDHEHPQFSLEATTGLLGPEAKASIEASADFLKLMNGSDKMTDSQFQTGLKAYEDKWFKQTISK